MKEIYKRLANQSPDVRKWALSVLAELNDTVYMSCPIRTTEGRLLELGQQFRISKKPQESLRSYATRIRSAVMETIFANGLERAKAYANDHRSGTDE